MRSIRMRRATLRRTLEARQWCVEHLASGFGELIRTPPNIVLKTRYVGLTGGA